MWGRLWQSWRTLGPEKVALFAACNLPWLDFRFELAPKAGFDTGAEHVWPLSPSRAYAHLLEGCSAPVYERSAARHETLSARQACGCACLGSLLSAAHVACAPCAMLKWRMPSCMRPRLHVAAVGHLDLIYTRVVTRREGFEFMNHSERAEHLALPMCGFERVAALILEPVSKGARIAHVVLWYLDVHSECMAKPLRATWRSTVSAWQSHCGLPSLCIASRHHA